ncbi:MULTISPECIES: hypothetical protein [unclassified Anabaena]|jgi:hypothetical protein|uniref:hypothetical protein n=1 Tax=unclassified Anabaena TaxID=2619674 RepID=UPI0006AC087A|nr:MULTISPECIES: hypothetical protein [unclassified Anabaena]ALB40797.1 hypothetical protein AA650_10195 [Anabaena sp. WA102]OBQ15976.1 MAG: hypothetical protein AN486_20950 [Anabaena sp. AL93]
MLKIRTFILALTLTPLLAINWQQPSQSQTSPSLGTAGGMSGGGNIGPINTSPSVGTGGGMSGGGTTGSNGNTDSNPDDNTSPSVGTGGGMSGGGTTGSNGNTDSNPDDNTSPSVGTGGSMSGGGTTGSGNTSPSVGNAGGQSGSPVTIVRTSRGNSLRITAERQDKLNRVAINIFTKENSKVLVAFRQPEAIRRGESNRFTEILRQAGVSPALAGRFIFTLIKIIPAPRPTTQSSGSVQLPKKYLVASTKALKFSPVIAQSDNNILPSVEVDINDLHNAINTYNQIIQESSPVTLQQLSENQDFVEIGKVLKELRAAVN